MNKKTILGTIMSILALFGFNYFAGEAQLGIAIPNIVATYEDSLQAKITATDTTMTLVRGTDDTGTALSGFYGFVIDEGSSNEEFVTCTASTTALTGCTRGISLTDGKTSVTALKQTHRKGASVKITNYPQLAILSRIANGQEGYPNALYFDANVDYTSASSSWIVDKNYADNLAISGSPLATTILQGIVQLGTTSDWGTSIGSTGASLVPTMSIASSTPVASHIVVADGTGRINAGWLSDVDFTWTGTHTFNGKMINTKISYVATASTTLTGATLPQPVYASSTLSNAILLSQATTTISTTAPVFEGFAISNATNGNSVYVQTEGVVGGFTGLTIGADYYIGTTTEGVITANVPTNSFPIVKVGKAISATELIIEKDKSFMGSATITASGSSGIPVDVYATSTIPWYVKSIIVNMESNLTNNTVIKSELHYEKYSKTVASERVSDSDSPAQYEAAITGTWNTTTGDLVWYANYANAGSFTGTLYFYK